MAAFQRTNSRCPCGFQLKWLFKWILGEGLGEECIPFFFNLQHRPLHRDYTEPRVCVKTCPNLTCRTPVLCCSREGRGGPAPIDITKETRGRDHASELLAALTSARYELSLVE